MGIVNRRNAMLGWVAWQAGKRVAKKKARGAMPGRSGASNRPNKGAIVSLLAAAVGGLWFWRRQRDEPED